MDKKSTRLFQSTQEAVSFGEQATLEDMSQLLRDTYKVLTNHLLQMSFDMQFFDEAYHAFKKDEWYESYQKCSKS